MLFLLGSTILLQIFSKNNSRFVSKLSDQITFTPGADGFQKSLHPCALDESSISIGSVKIISLLNTVSSEAQGCKGVFDHPLNPACHIGIRWIALAEYSQMSTLNLPGFK